MDTKLQIILVSGNVKDYIDKFDLDFIKSYYDGETIHIQNLNSILTRTSSVSDTHQNRCKFERHIRRIKKYKKRGYTINIPKIINLTESTKTDKYLTYLKKMQMSGLAIHYWYKKIDEHTLEQIKEIKGDKHHKLRDSEDIDYDNSYRKYMCDYNSKHNLRLHDY